MAVQRLGITIICFTSLEDKGRSPSEIIPPQSSQRAACSSLGLVIHQAAIYGHFIFPLTWCVGCRMWAISYLCCLKITFWNHPLAHPSPQCSGGQESQQDIWLVGRRDKGERLLSVLMWHFVIAGWQDTLLWCSLVLVLWDFRIIY